MKTTVSGLKQKESLECGMARNVIVVAAVVRPHRAHDDVALER